MVLAQNAILSAHTLILEDGPHAEEGGDVLEGMFAEGCSPPRDSRISVTPHGSPFPSDNEDEEMTYDQERLIRRFRNGRKHSTVSGASLDPVGIVSKDPSVAPT
jgi:hypothetical protein